jgi:hypothetical protein
MTKLVYVVTLEVIDANLIGSNPIIHKKIIKLLYNKLN